MRLLDSIAARLGYVKPRPRKERASWGYDAAQMSRLTASLQNEAQFINTTLRYQGRTLRARARQAAQNNPFAKRFVQMVVDNVCGPEPFCLEGKVKNARGKFDEKANEQLEDGWYDWSRAGECEITGKWSFNTVQRLLCRIWATDGELLVRRLRGPDYGRYGFRLQLIDIDRLYELKNQALSNGGAIHSSIELDPYGRPVAYWVLKRKPAQWQFTGYNVTDFERIDADEITHVFAPEFAEQARGVPMMYAALLNLVHLGAFEEAAVIAARIGAAQMFVIEAPDGGKTLADMAAPGPNSDGTESYGAGNGDLQLQADPGSSFTLPAGYKLSTGWNPKYPDAAIEPFIKACLRGISAGLGVAYHNLANDMEGVNYSSARIAELDERDTWRGMQQFWIEHFCQPVYDDWLKMAVLAGALPFDIARLDKYRAVHWQARRWAWVDPLKEVGASIEAINARITSRSRVAAENGVDLEDVFDEIAAEEQMAKDKKIDLIPVQPQATGTIPNDQVEGGADGGDGGTGGEGKKSRRWRDTSRGAEPEDAIQFHSHVHVAGPEVRVSAPEVKVTTPAVTVKNEVKTPSVSVHNHVEPTPVEVKNEVKVEPTPVTVVSPIEVIAKVEMPERSSVSEVERNSKGEITRVTQTEKSA